MFQRRSASALGKASTILQARLICSATVWVGKGCSPIVVTPPMVKVGPVVVHALRKFQKDNG